MKKRYLDEVSPPHQPLPPAPQRSLVQTLFDEEGAKAQGNGISYVPCSLYSEPLETVGSRGPRGPSKIAGESHRA